jgi:molybdopterin converting factor small subunit
MKTLIELDRPIWARVKYFAAIRDITLKSALELLLTQALDRSGYSIQKEEERS